MNIFTAVKYCCISHGLVFVMKSHRVTLSAKINVSNQYQFSKAKVLGLWQRSFRLRDGFTFNVIGRIYPKEHEYLIVLVSPDGPQPVA